MSIHPGFPPAEYSLKAIAETLSNILDEFQEFNKNYRLTHKIYGPETDVMIVPPGPGRPDPLGKDYVCPQCGPDPEGSAKHAENFHQF